MTTDAITDLEWAMYNRGYASIRLIAQKTNIHKTTIYRWIRNDDLESVEVSGKRFVAISSVGKYMGADASRLFDLNDWSDIFVYEDE